MSSGQESHELLFPWEIPSLVYGEERSPSPEETQNENGFKKNLPPPDVLSLKIVATAPDEAKHQNDVMALLYHKDTLITGADDGKIKVWTPELSLISEVQAHPVNVYSMTVVGETLYSCSNDGTLKAWDVNTLQLKTTLMDDPKSEIIKLYADNGILYAGNEQGELFVWDNERLVHMYSLMEDIQDFLVIGDLVFNARNVDVSVTEMMGAPRFNYMSRGAMIGRFPIRFISNKICFLSRCGKNIYVHEGTKELKFQRVAEIKAHAMTISAMTRVVGRDQVMLSSSYDRFVKAWDMTTMKRLGGLEVGVCCNAMSEGPPSEFFISSCDGYLAKGVINDI